MEENRNGHPVDTGVTVSFLSSDILKMSMDDLTVMAQS